MSEVYCPGGALQPSKTRDRDMPKASGEGMCPACGEWRKLTAAGQLRRHKVEAVAVEPRKGFQPPDEPLELPDDEAESDAGEEPKAKTNPTPDLTDEEYLEQMALIAQSIAVMPAQREGLPNVTTPPPIRPLWAKFMISQGIRIHPPLATHKLRNPAPKAAGNFGPREMVPLKRASMNRDDLLHAWKEMNPESFQGIHSGAMSREALMANLPEQMQALIKQAEEMAAREREEAEKEAPPQ